MQYADGNTATYTYDETGRLTYHDDPRAPIATTMHYIYDETGIIIEIDDDGEREFWRKVQAPRINQGEATKTVVIEDDLGNTNEYEFDWTSGNLKQAAETHTLQSILGPLAFVNPFDTLPLEFEWEDGQLLRTLPRIVDEDAGRNSVIYEYAAPGHISRIRSGYPGFSAEYTTHTAIQDGLAFTRLLPTQVAFADGTSQTNEYDGRGWVETFTNRYGAVTEFEWNPQHQVTAQVRLDDKVRLDYQYNPVGLITSIQQTTTDPDDLGHTISYGYDNIGRLTSIVDPLLGTYTISYHLVPTSDGSVATQMQVLDPTQTINATTWDASGQIIEERTYPANGNEYLKRTTFAYDHLRRLVQETRWDQVDSGETPLTTHYVYTSVPALPSQPGDDPNDFSNRVVRGHSISRIDPMGRTDTYTYDANGRIRQTVDSSGKTMRYDYDFSPIEGIVNGITVKVREILNGRLLRSERFFFDVRWQLRGIERDTDDPEVPDTWSVFYEGDSIQVRAVRARPAGVIELNWEGYVDGRPPAVTHVPSPKALLSGAGQPEVTLAADFGGTGQAESVTLADGTTYSEIQCFRSNGILETRYFASLDVDIEAPCELGRFDYAVQTDFHGRVIQIDGPNGTRTYSYTAGQNTWNVTIDFSGSNWQLTYDGVGNLLQWIDASGILRGYRYDRLGRLVAITVPDQPEASFTYAYNAGDLLVSELDGLGRGTRYDYDNVGRLIVEQDERTANATIYSYNADGQLSAVISPLGNTTTFRYDPDNPTRLIGIIEPSGSTTSFDWNSQTRTITYVDPRNNQTVYYFDSFGQLYRIDDALGRTHEIHYDGQGRITEWWRSQPDSNGQSPAQHITFDHSLETLTLSESSTDSWRRQFTFLPNGQLAGISGSSEQALSFAYDPTDRLTEASTNTRQWTLAYQANDPALTYTDDFGVAHVLRFDALNRLIQDDTTTYTYQRSRGADVDVDGRRITAHRFSPLDQVTPAHVRRRLLRAVLVSGTRYYLMLKVWQLNISWKTA